VEGGIRILDEECFKKLPLEDLPLYELRGPVSGVEDVEEDATVFVLDLRRRWKLFLELLVLRESWVMASLLFREGWGDLLLMRLDNDGR